MTQIFNILRKDVRYLRLEVLASLAVLVLFILAEPKTWMARYGGGASETAQIISFLVVFSWGVLILRLVHAERLAGLNQFWTTRPYEWPKLLAAKALFIALFVYIPFLMAQVYLLHHADLSVASNLGPILYNLLRLTCVAILPLVCVAVVTTSFGQAVLSALGILVAIIGGQSIFGYFGSISATFGLPRYAPLFLLSLELAIALIFFASAILLQYSRRVTFKSIAVLAAAAVVLVLTPQFLRGSTAAVSGYAAAMDAPASVSIDTSKRQDFSAYLPRNPRTAVYRIPLQFSNLAPGISLSREAQRYTLTTTDGYTWTSDWLDDQSDFGGLAPNSGETIAHSRTFIDIPWPVVPHVVGRPISLRIEFLGAQLKSETPYTYSLPTDVHAVPGLGVCALDDAEDNIFCRSAFGDFAFVTASTMGTPDPCDASPDTVPVSAPSIPETGFLVGPRRLHGNPIPLISPVMVNSLHLNAPHNQPIGHPCPGTPVTFIVRGFQGRIYLATPPATITLNAPPPGGRVGP